MTAKDGLKVQDLAALKPEELTPLTPEVISRQATINIGTIGHVDHGKVRAAVPAAIARTPGARARARARGAARRSGRLIAPPHG